jgi:hypothetical protein
VQVVTLALQVRDAFDVALDRGLLAAQSSRRLGIFPKIGMRGFLFEVFQVGAQFGEVKDAPEVR